MHPALKLALAVAALAGWTLAVGPTLVDLAKRLTNSLGNIDFSLRIHFAYATGLVLLGLLYGLFARPPNDRRARLVMTALAIEAVILLAVWVLDPHEFTREVAAITFFSAAILLMASLLAALNVPASYANPERHPRAGLFWSLVAAAFLLAGLDEYFTIHEAIGHALAPFSREAGLPRQFFQDGVTISYAVGAVVFVALFYGCFRAELLRRGQVAGKLLLTGIAVYAVSVVNDVLDFLAERLFPMANPEHAMNFAEEVLEFTAAVLFVCAFAAALLERTPAAFDRVFPEPRSRPGFRRFASVAILAAVAVSLALPVVLLFTLDGEPWARTSNEALTVTVFADATDGLDSIDELVFAPGLGLLAGNEGTGEVLAFDADGASSVFADDIGSPDGLAVGAGSVYVADEARRAVLEYDYDGRLVRTIDGWQTPEGVALHGDGTVFVADLTRRHVVAVRGETSRVVANARHGLMSPEQVALDPMGNLYIADERTRTVFRRTPDGRVAAFLGTGDGLRVPESLIVHNDYLWIVDSERSAIHRFDLNGTGGVWLAFRERHDLGGIAFDEAGTLYLAVVSDYRPDNRILAVTWSAP